MAAIKEIVHTYFMLKEFFIRAAPTLDWIAMKTAGTHCGMLQI
jgi:hypothetical protein